MKSNSFLKYLLDDFLDFNCFKNKSLKLGKSFFNFIDETREVIGI